MKQLIHILLFSATVSLLYDTVFGIEGTIAPMKEPHTRQVKPAIAACVVPGGKTMAGRGYDAPKKENGAKRSTGRKNEAAPLRARDVRESAAEKYIERFSNVARGEMSKFGIPASITLAQGLIESRAGQSKLARLANNHFGIKCFSKRCGKSHCMNFTDDSHKDYFVKYTTAWCSYRAHSLFLKSGSRYSKLFTYGSDYAKWAKGLKRAGYATSRTYAEDLVSVIERYNLHRFDK